SACDKRQRAVYVFLFCLMLSLQFGPQLVLNSILRGSCRRLYRNPQGEAKPSDHPRNLLPMQKRTGSATPRKPTGDVPPAGEQLFRAVFDNALEAMVIADDEGNYIDAN